MGIPLVFKNFSTKTCSVLGISKIRAQNEEIRDNISGNADYIHRSLIDKFGMRWESNLKT